MPQLYEYAIILNPKARRDAQGNDTTERGRLIGDVKRVVATGEREVTFLAAREIPDDLKDRLEEVEVVVRPF